MLFLFYFAFSLPSLFYLVYREIRLFNIDVISVNAKNNIIFNQTNFG